MRSGKWKYIRDGKNEFLYDLSVDEHEQADFKESDAARIKLLREQFRKWESEMPHYPRTAA